MDLLEVSVTGFRRFKNKSTLKTNGKLVALVGPNEAGKSSYLDAIMHLGHDEVPPESSFTRGVPRSSFEIEGRYFLSSEDAEAAGLENPTWLVVKKTAEGQRSFRLEPNAPQRDLHPRGQLLAALDAALTVARLYAAAVDEVHDFQDKIEAGRRTLESTAQNLPESDVDTVAEFCIALGSLTRPRDPAAVRRIAEAANFWKETELKTHPNTFALLSLRKRIPAIVFFDDEARNLKEEYTISSLRDNAPDALGNLCEVAGLNIEELVDVAARSDSARLTTLEYAANDVLQKKFEEYWKQSGVHVNFRFEGDVLLIQVKNELFEFTSFAERSDGLRQFVALQSFSMCNWSGSTILLIDEAEQRLHYDAQADLVQMLTKQMVASKVIYTTHSAGCLPEDIGNGVRLVRPNSDEKTRSEISNKFWIETEPGFAPLLFGMGASTLAFFPTRNALMVEGPSDLLLLPAMLREALEVPFLGFQIVPGLSESDKRTYAPIMSRKSRLLYLVDGDDGGNETKKQLNAVGVDKENIFTLKSSDGRAIELEDFVDPNILMEGVNRLLQKYHGASKEISKKDLVASKRTKSLKKWYKDNIKAEIRKVELAYEILDLIFEDPNRNLIDSSRKSNFKAIANSISQRFLSLKS